MITLCKDQQSHAHRAGRIHIELPRHLMLTAVAKDGRQLIVPPEEVSAVDIELDDESLEKLRDDLNKYFGGAG